MLPAGQKYVSVDLELTGFDTETDEIIEIGMVRFAAQAGHLVRGQTFESLVKPRKTIRPRILGLTGLEAEKIMQAPDLDALRPQISGLLEDAILVGHGVSLDRQFLAAQGFALHPVQIDTLELAQIFLPTYHSYNLESLSRAFGFEHIAVHRALGDAEATVALLESLCGVFNDLPESLQSEILRVARLQHLSWAELFTALPNALPATPQGLLSEPRPIFSTTPPPALPGPTVLVTEGAGQFLPELADLRRVNSGVVAVPDREQVLVLAKATGLPAYVGAYEEISQAAVEQMIARAGSLSSRETIALLKVMVWQAGIDKHFLASMNWSLLGTDAKRWFNAGHRSLPPGGLCLADYRSMPDFFPLDFLWLDQLDSFVEFLEGKSGYQINWAGAVKAVSDYFGLTGDATLTASSGAPELWGQAVAALDVFFASGSLLLKNQAHLGLGVWPVTAVSPAVWNRLKQAASNLLRKWTNLGLLSEDTGFFANFSHGLQSYFALSGAAAVPDVVRWLDIGRYAPTFVQKNLDLSVFAGKYLQANQLVLQTDIRWPSLLGYFLDRLGLAEATVVEVRPEVGQAIDITLDQVKASDVYQALSEKLREQSGVLVVFSDLAELKEYYDEEFVQEDSAGPVLAVGIHGGFNKILRNWQWHEDKTIFATLSHLAAFKGEAVVTGQLIIVGLPKVAAGHPYHQALAREYVGDFNRYAELMRLLALVRIARVLALDKLQRITWIIEPENAHLAVNLFQAVFTHNLSTNR